MIKCAMFSAVMDVIHSESAISEFIEKVGWSNILQIVPLNNGLVFFYEEALEEVVKDNEEIS